MDTSEKGNNDECHKKKHVQIGEAKIFNNTLLCSRVIGLQASSRETIDIQNLLSYKLAPIPTSMFPIQVTGGLVRVQHN